MPLPILKQAVIPNSIYFPKISFVTDIINNKQVISAYITLAAAKVTDAGLETETWVDSGQTQTVYLPDIMNLEPDIESLSGLTSDIYNGFISLINDINNIREVL